MSKLKQLLGCHYAQQNGTKDKMLGELSTGDENIKDFLDVVVVLEEMGASINILDD